MSADTPEQFAKDWKIEMKPGEAWLADPGDATFAKTMLPRYQCHKQVYALKIEIIECMGHLVWLIPEDRRYSKFEVSEEFFAKHQPKAPGYYVVYDDGYKSWSPAAAFESGYTRL